MYADAGPPLVLMTLGLVLWLAVTATVAGLSIQTIGLILFLAGLVWLVIEMLQARTVRRGPVAEPVVYREEPVVYREEPVVRREEPVVRRDRRL